MERSRSLIDWALAGSRPKARQRGLGVEAVGDERHVVGLGANRKIHAIAQGFALERGRRGGTRRGRGGPRGSMATIIVDSTSFS